MTEGRLIGGLDLAATLAAGRPVAERGLLAEAAGGVLVVPMAERLEVGVAGLVAAALDTGEVVVERDGLALRAPARFACVLLDEGQGDERAPETLAERLAFRLDLDGVVPLPLAERGQGWGSWCASPPSKKSPPTPPPSPPPQGGGEVPDSKTIHAARARLAAVAVDDEVVAALAAAGLVFGVPSLRIATLALRAAKAAAALANRDHVAAEDAELAAALVIAPRATSLPATEQDEAPEDSPPPAAPPDETPPGDGDDDKPVDPDALTDLVVEATRAAIPADLLAALSAAATAPRQSAGGGRAGVARKAAKRGRPTGTRRGVPGHGVRLAIVETLRAAAPWQRLRRQTSPQTASGRILVRRDDFRVARFKEKSETLTLFVVDASGSAALHRLAEVKGAVELILAECYIRRDQVALIAFRGTSAEPILPPTRSLVRAKRALAGLVGGGGTPLAAAIEAAVQVAYAARRRGHSPVAVFLTDGKANIGRTGRPGRAQAEADALAAAGLFRAGGASGLVLDIAPRPAEAAARLAAAMGARYIPLPYADARSVSRAVMTAATAGNV